VGHNNTPLLVAGTALRLGRWRPDWNEPLGGVETALNQVRFPRSRFSAEQIDVLHHRATQQVLTSELDGFDSEQDFSTVVNRTAARLAGVPLGHLPAVSAGLHNTEQLVHLVTSAKTALSFAKTGELPQA
jgi:hypothetical protein